MTTTEGVLVLQDVRLLDAMRQLNVNGKRALVVVESYENQRLVGTLSDGDIRRYILKTGELNTTVGQIVNPHPKVLSRKSRVEAMRIFENTGISLIPIINENRKVVDVVYADNYRDLSHLPTGKLDCGIVIMAGGAGTRLFPYTKVLPKALIPIGDVPIVERIIANFSIFGIESFMISLYHKKNLIKSYFAESQLDFQLEYIEEEEPLGTVGCLGLARNRLKGDFFITNCDILVDGDYLEFLKIHRSLTRDITIIAAEKRTVIPYGVLQIDEAMALKSISEKPSYSHLVNTGMYIFKDTVLELIEDHRRTDMNELIQKAMINGLNVGVIKVQEDQWMDMGQLQEMDRMQDLLLRM